MFSDSEFIQKLSTRVKNPALEDSELLEYIIQAKGDVEEGNYNESNYNAQVLDQACVYLVEDNKFPEINSISQGGVTTSFSSNSIKTRYLDRIRARRQAAWMSG